MENPQYPQLFTPINIRDFTVKNRIMSAPNMIFQTIGGRPSDYYTGYLEHKARGGAGIVTLGEAAVGDGGHHVPPMEMTEDNLALYGEMAAAIHEHGALASVELTHGGMRSKQQYNKRGLLGPVTCVTEAGASVTAMTEQDMDDVAKAHIDSALYWRRAGFDAVHVHSGHTWLFPQFLSPILNRRTDKYGGSLENRMRFPLMVLRRMREALGGNMLITMRQSGSERCEGGFTTDDVIEFLALAQEYIDMVEISTERMELAMPMTYMPRGLNVGFSETIKKSGRINIPVFVIGAILDPDQAEEIVASEKADGVSMSRALIADPYFPIKARTGRAEDITPCLRCMNCTDFDNRNRHFVCSVNPLAGREARLGFGDALSRAALQRSVLVIGGGPAGMKAALTARRRGHSVTLVEKSDSLGGLLKFTNSDSLKHDLRRYKDYLIRQLERSGVDIRLNTEADAALAEKLSPDHIIVATGSTPVFPGCIKGAELSHPASDVYFNPGVIRGDNIVIIGGGLVGLEAGLHLCNTGKSVTVLEAKAACAEDAGNGYRRGVMVKAEELGLSMITQVKTLEITEKGVRYEKDGTEHFAAADTILYAVGMQKDDRLFFELTNSALFVEKIGDCKRVGKVTEAIHTGYFSALDIGAF